MGAHHEGKVHHVRMVSVLPSVRSESQMTVPIPLLSTASGAPVATTEGAELLGIAADKLVMACRRGNL